MRSVLQTKLALWAVCLQRAGSQAPQVVEFIDDWRDCVKAHDGPVSWQGYANWTRRYTSRTAYRRLATFREAFPELGPHGSPEDLLGPLLARLAEEAASEDVTLQTAASVPEEAGEGAA